MQNGASMMTGSFLCRSAALAGLLSTLSSAYSASIDDVVKQIDVRTGKPRETNATYTVSGIVSARATLADGRVFAYLHFPGSAGAPVVASPSDAAKLQTRNEVELTGRLGDGPSGLAALLAKDGAIAVTATNKSVGAAELRGPDFFKDAASLAGRYVSLTNVTFSAPAFDDSGQMVVKGDAGDVHLLVTSTLKGKATPAGRFNIFGVPVRINGEWRLLAARFISVNNKAAQATAAKRTCFTCHNPDMKVVGPSYRDVAAKYKNDPDAVAKILNQIERGGGGKWGPVPMPALGSTVPVEERKQLVEWIYGYRWDAFLSE